MAMTGDNAPAPLKELLTSLREGGRGLMTDGEHGGHGHDHGGHGHDHGGHGQHGEPGTATSVREAIHNGHVITIETTYFITIDGQPLEGHLEVLDNGSVHYHGLPNYAVPSAIDLMRLVIDHFGTEPPAEDELGGHTHDGH